MAKKYVIERDRLTWMWTWHCTDGSDQGEAGSKSQARQRAKAACDAYVIGPPKIDAEVREGHLATFSARNLDGERVTFSSKEISEDLFFYLAGMDCANPKNLKPAAVAAAILKTFGVYRGGNSEEEIKKRHALTTKQFNRLVRQKFEGMTLTVNDDKSLQWDLAPHFSLSG